MKSIDQMRMKTVLGATQLTRMFGLTIAMFQSVLQQPFQ